jgi:hypothetical protein
MNVDNLGSVRHEARHFKNEDEIELAFHSKNKNVRDLHSEINQVKEGYQPRINLVKDENSDLLADSRNILNR